MSEYVAIKRNPAEEDKAMLKESLRRVQHALPSYVSASFRTRGSMGLRYLTVNEYEWVRKDSMPFGELETEEIAEMVRYGLGQLPGSDEPIEATVADTIFLGRRDPVHIVYKVDSPQIVQERSAITQVIESLSGVDIEHRAFVPHLRLAGIERVGAGMKVLEAFREVMPSVVRLEPVKVAVASSAH